MAIAGISSAATSTAQNAFGLDFQSLLQIILTQLTYQDPLKPVDNFQFVSQLAQFSQLQQTQTLNDQITSLLSAQAATQATSLLGRTVDLSSNTGTRLSGEVTAISFSTGQPLVTIQTADGQTIGGISIANVSQVR
jgi:flagellar basal-body rod modification protein FlgD